MSAQGLAGKGVALPVGHFKFEVSVKVSLGARARGKGRGGLIAAGTMVETGFELSGIGSSRQKRCWTGSRKTGHTYLDADSDCKVSRSNSFFESQLFISFNRVTAIPSERRRGFRVGISPI